MILCLISGCIRTTLASSTNSPWCVRAWQTDEGLPNNIVTAITQTQDGCLWVGTPAGLARFDGIDFTEFSYLRSGVNGHPSIHTLLPGASGGLWIAPSRGPAVHLDRQFSPAPLPANLPDANCLIVAQDRDGNAWIGYANGMVCEIKDGQVVQFAATEGLPGGTIESLISDRAGNIWIAKGSRIYVFKDGRFQQVGAFRGESHLTAAGTNGVWIVAGKQLLRCDTAGRLHDVGTYLPEGSHGVAREALEDHTGAVWIGTDTEGLYRYSESGFEKIETSYAYISSLAEDSEGNIWAGTLGGGLYRVSPGGIEIEKVNGSSPEPIQSICQGTDGVLWGATLDGLLVSRVNGMWTAALTNLDLPKSVTCVAADKGGRVWIGARGKSFYCLSNNKITAWDDKKGYSGTAVTSLYPDSKGNVWVGLNAYHEIPPVVQCLRDGEFRTFKLPTNSDRIFTMTEDAAGNIWAGTPGGILLRLEGEKFVDETSLTSVSDRAVRCLCATPDGALWIGYAGLGLGRLKNNHFNRITTEQGLRENSISQIVPDNHGWFWLGGDHGIFKVRHLALDAVIRGELARVTPVFYGRNEGLFNVQANFGFWPGAIRTRDGDVLIPTRTGLATIAPAMLDTTATVPRVQLTQVIVDDRTVAAEGGGDETQAVANLRSPQPRLRLSPYHRSLKFEFTAFSFSAPENVHFRYRLDGLDNDWLDAEAREASYSRLARGQYEFRAEAADGDGPWREAHAPLTIVVDPFFWQKWWFSAGLLALFALCVVAVVRYVSFRRLRRKLEVLAQQAALDKERTRIARDLHDDLGGSLTQVKQFYELALRNNASPDKMRDYLRQGLAKTQSSIKALDETVWAVNPHNDTLPYLIDYIGQSAVAFLHAADIRCRADLPASPPERTISAEARHNLFLVVKEALNNVVRHAHATEVQLQATVTDESLRLAIKDDGKGFEQAPDNSTADGLRNMGQRMQEIGGQFSVESKPGAGTRISLVYFWPQRGASGNGNHGRVWNH